MATLQDIVYSAAINLLSALVFLLAFAILRLQPINDRVYFPKWYLKGIRASPIHSRAIVSKFVNMDLKTYIRFLNWMPAALRMPEPELIDHAGLDSVVYIRIYLMGLKIFVPITLLAFAVLVPVNWTGGTLEQIKDLTFSNIDKLSISNIPPGSKRFCAHVLMSYIFTFWTFYVIYKEYKTTAFMRLQFLASESRRPDQFTVLVRNVPPDPDESVTEHVEHFFCVNHPDHYLTHQVVYNANKLANLVAKKKSLQNWLTYHQNKYERNPSSKPTTKTGFWGLWGTRVDAIDYYTAEIGKLSEEIINVYNQKYESGAAFWPDVHRRLIIGLIIAQLLLLGLMSTKEARELTPLLVALPILTIWFHVFCKGRFESAFVKFPLQDAMVRDTLERATDPNLNLKMYLQDAYIHPVFRGGELERPEIIDEEEDNPLVPTTRNSQKSQSKYSSDVSSGAGS
ncbi:hypothetical protein GH714_037124 [Hevea brasiliensis]|uniref:Uncharacterized protein n=1 Tax=Hevea brasiliensis TaxID=3981 RepID=A0A6A6MMC0_HEVBR|nr:hypothetical protein GH714_037124 [Hevea brasiliensis]